jgi:peptidoglycan/LPS O-acetylase OafA/YrhL
VEEQFYLVFGALIFLVPRQHVILAITVALVGKVALFGVYGQVDADSTALRIIFSYQEAILLGVLLAFAMNHRPVYERVARWLGSGAALGIVVVALMAWLLTHRMHAASHWDAEISYVLMTLLVAAVAIRVRPRLLEGGLLVHIGKVSYGMYLLHMIVFSTAKKLPGGDSPWVCFVVTTVGTVVAASIAYRYFEAPIIRWYKQRLSPVEAATPKPADPAVTASQSLG